MTVIAMILAIVPTVSSQDETPDLTFTGSEGPGCAPDALLCFDIDGDAATAFVAGQDVTIKVVAAGEAPHNVHFIADGEQMDMGDPTTFTPGGTDGSKAIAASETVHGGESTVFTFTVPQDATKLYYWCDVPDFVVGAIGDHEMFGMRGTVDVLPPVEEKTDNETQGNGTDDGNTTADGNDTADGDQTADGDVAGGAEGDVDDNNTTADGAGTDDEEFLPVAPWVGFAAVGIAAVVMGRRRR